jgi:GNAT superfamily N-acetyltransferase
VPTDPLVGPRPLRPSDQTAGFDCGVDGLNVFLRRWAGPNEAAHASRTYVLVRGDRVVAYHSIAAASIRKDFVTTRIGAGLSAARIPMILIGRLAVDLPEQGNGLGRRMLVDALERTASASIVIGARGVLVHAGNARARDFYLHHDFAELPARPGEMAMLMKDELKTLGLS